MIPTNLLQAQPGNTLLQNIAGLQSGMLSAPAQAPTNPFPLVPYGGYGAPAQGSQRGSALFRGGLGANNNNPLDINEWGAGLWAQGVDPNDPNLGNILWELNRQKMGGSDPDYQKRVSEQVAKHGWDLNTQSGLSNAVDWYYRDLSRRMDQSNSFLDSTLGKILGTVGQVALGAIPGVGPALGAGLGAYMGQRNDGGVLGGLLGAAGGYGAGKLGSSLATKGLTGTVNSTVNSVKGLLGGGSGGGFVNPAGLGSAANLYNPASLAGDIGVVGGLGNVASNGLGLAPNVARSLYAPLSLLGNITQGSGAPIQDGPTHPAIPGPAHNQTQSPGLLEAVGDLYDANGGLKGLASDALSGLRLASLGSGLLGAQAPAAQGGAGGMLGQGWGGKFRHYQSPYGGGRLPRPRGIHTDIAGVT